MITDRSKLTVVVNTVCLLDVRHSVQFQNKMVKGDPLIRLRLLFQIHTEKRYASLTCQLFLAHRDAKQPFKFSGNWFSDGR